MTAPPTITPGGARGQRGQIVLRALLLVLAAGLLLFAGGRQRWRWDLSEGARNSLSPRTVELLRALPEAPSITLYLPDREPERARCAALFGACQAERPGLRWTVVDPGREPARALAAGVQSSGTVVVRVGEREERYSIERAATGDYPVVEAPLAQSFMALARGTAPRLVLVQGPGLRALQGPEGLAGLASLCEGAGWSVTPWWPLAERAPVPPPELLLLPGPHLALPPALLDALVTQLDAGAGLLVLLDPAAEMADSSRDAGLGPLLAARGIHPGPGFVVDLSEENIALDRGFEVPVVLRYAPHPATRDFLDRPEPTCFPLARALDLDADVPVPPVPLLLTGDRCFEETGPLDGTAHRDEGVDRPGPFVLAAASDSSATGGGPLLVVGDSHFVTAAQLDWYGNGRFLLDALSWLGRERLRPGLVRAPREARVLTLTRGGRRAYTLLSLLALPLALLAVWPLRLAAARARRRGTQGVANSGGAS